MNKPPSTFAKAALLAGILAAGEEHELMEAEHLDGKSSIIDTIAAQEHHAAVGEHRNFTIDAITQALAGNEQETPWYTAENDAVGLQNFI